MTEAKAIAEFPYRVRWATVFLVVGFFGIAAIFLGFKAATNERGLIINGVIELGPDGASVFFWVLAALSGVFTALGIVMALQRLIWPMRIAFTADGIIAPSGPLSRTEMVIPYQEILGLRVYRINSHDMIELTRPQGSYKIYGIRLPSAAAVREVADLILKHCPHLQAPSSPPPN